MNQVMKPILGTLAAFVVMFGLAGIFNTFLIADLLRQNVNPVMLRTPQNRLLIGLGYLVLALLMTALYPRIARADHPVFLRGLLFGMIIGLLWMLPMSLVLHGVYNLPGMALLLDTAWALIEQGLGGVVIAVIYGRDTGK
ncbi:MAG: hypothetical protein AB1898_29270 [Acidobacteriota bacterium]